MSVVRYEKLISGKYLGETVRLVLQSLIKNESVHLFDGKSSPTFDTFEKFETKYLSFIEDGYVYISHKISNFYLAIIICTIMQSISLRDINVCKDLLRKDFSIEASEEDCEIVKRVCEAITTRAARMAAVGIVALVKKINKIDGCTVAVDGSLYKKHPKFSTRCVCSIYYSYCSHWS